MKKLRALIVDDSSVNRILISSLLEGLHGVESVEVAPDGAAALRMVEKNPPDFITLDLHMPNIDGFKFMRLLSEIHPIPVVVISSYSQKENIFRALELGALDFIEKPDVDEKEAVSRLRRELGEKVRIVRQLSPIAFKKMSQDYLKLDIEAQNLDRLSDPALRGDPSWLVVIGASTGGPGALVRLFKRIPGDVDAAFLVAQHMPAKFTHTFANRLNRVSKLRVREARRFERLFRGCAYVCPGGHRMEVTRSEHSLATRVSPPEATDRYVPSVDALFDSAARVMGDKVIALLLTGMGDDGAHGAGLVKSAGGRVIVQSSTSAVVQGMPEAALRVGAVDESLDVEDIAAKIAELTQGE